MFRGIFWKEFKWEFFYFVTIKGNFFTSLLKAAALPSVTPVPALFHLALPAGGRYTGFNLNWTGGPEG